MKLLHFIKNRVFLKYAFAFLALLLAGTLFLYKSHQTEIKVIEQKKKDNSAEIKKYINEADLLFDNSSYESAYVLYKKAIALCDPIDDYADDYVYSELSIANLYQNMNNYMACEESLMKIFPHLKKTSLPKFTYNTYTILAYNYYFTYDYNNALLYHRKALKLAATPFKKMVIITDIALTYSAQKRFKEAIDVLEPMARKKIRHESDSVKTDNNYSVLLNNLGFCYYKVGNPKALDCLKKSLEIQLRLKIDYELMSTYNNLAMYYSKIDPKLSKKYTEIQYETSCRAKSASFQANTLGELIKKSDGKELEQYSKAYVKIIDSILSSRKYAKNQFAIIKYESKNDKEENLKLKAEKVENELQIQKHKNRNLISYIIITITLVILLFLALYLSIKGKKEKKEAVFESEMRISSKLHNELTKDLHRTLSFAQNENLENNLNKNQLLTSLDKIYSQTRNISRENSSIVTKENYDLGLKEMISSFKTSNLNILINGLNDIHWIKIDKHKKIIIYRVLQEILLNMKRHSEATLAGVNFKIIKKNILINYTDNGKGVKINQVTKSGLQIIEKRILSVKGEIQLESNPGNGFKISFKIPV